MLETQGPQFSLLVFMHVRIVLSTLHAAIFQTLEGKQAFSTDIAPFVYTVESWWLSGK